MLYSVENNNWFGLSELTVNIGGKLLENYSTCAVNIHNVASEFLHHVWSKETRITLPGCEKV